MFCHAHCHTPPWRFCFVIVSFKLIRRESHLKTLRMPHPVLANAHIVGTISLISIHVFSHQSNQILCRVAFVSMVTVILIPRPCVPVILKGVRRCFKNNVNMNQYWWGLDSVAILHRFDYAKVGICQEHAPVEQWRNPHQRRYLTETSCCFCRAHLR